MDAPNSSGRQESDRKLPQDLDLQRVSSIYLSVFLEVMLCCSLLGGAGGDEESIESRHDIYIYIQYI